MHTLNISLPEKLSVKIDRIVEEEGYASRSEFIRTLLRLYFQLTKAEAKLTQPFFVPFKKRPLVKVRRELEKTGFYNKSFIKSVISGLKKSSVYAG